MYLSPTPYLLSHLLHPSVCTPPPACHLTCWQSTSPPHTGDNSSCEYVNMMEYVNMEYVIIEWWDRMTGKRRFTQCVCYCLSVCMLMCSADVCVCIWMCWCELIKVKRHGSEWHAVLWCVVLFGCVTAVMYSCVLCCTGTSSISGRSVSRSHPLNINHRYPFFHLFTESDRHSLYSLLQGVFLWPDLPGLFSHRVLYLLYILTQHETHTQTLQIIYVKYKTMLLSIIQTIYTCHVWLIDWHTKHSRYTLYLS